MASIKDTEFGGDGSQPYPVERGYELKNYEKLRKIYAVDPMDEVGAPDVVTERSA